MPWPLPEDSSGSHCHSLLAGQRVCEIQKVALLCNRLLCCGMMRLVCRWCRCWDESLIAVIWLMCLRISICGYQREVWTLWCPAVIHLTLEWILIKPSLLSFEQSTTGWHFDSETSFILNLLCTKYRLSVVSSYWNKLNCLHSPVYSQTNITQFIWTPASVAVKVSSRHVQHFRQKRSVNYWKMCSSPFTLSWSLRINHYVNMVASASTTGLVTQYFL